MKYSYAVAALVLVGVGTWLLLGHREAAAPERDFSNASFPYTKDARGDRVHKESTDVYSITATYPDQSSAGTSAAVTMEAWVAEDIARFKADGNLDNLTPEDKRIQGLSGERKYALSIEYKRYEGAKTTSYVFLAYQDTLGAHPNGFYMTFTFDKESGSEVRLSDLFIAGVRYLDKLSIESFMQVKAELARRTGTPITGEMEDTVRIGTSPTPETLQFFYVDGNYLVVIIPPYQAAAYAAGTFEVKIPLSSLRDILKPEYRD